MVDCRSVGDNLADGCAGPYTRQEDGDETAWVSPISKDDDSSSASEAIDDEDDDGSLTLFGLRRRLAATAVGVDQLNPGRTSSNVTIRNSKDVHVGDKTFFNGPVTIRQIVYAKDVYEAAATAVPAIHSGASVTCVDPAAPESPVMAPVDDDIEVLNPIFAFNGGYAEKAMTAQVDTGQDAKATWLQRLWKKKFRRDLAFCGVAAALLIFGLVLTASRSLRDLLDDVDSTSTPELPGPWITPENNLTLSGKLRIIPRRDWLAQPARAREFLKPPVPYVIISHSASEGCDKQAACVAMVRNLQTFHIESRGWADIGYNFMVGGDGYVYEGRGWDVVGAHAYGYNNRSVGINMVGTFIDVLPPERQLLALRQIIELGAKEKHIAEDYKLLAHRQVSATESPGAAFFEELKKWPHWSPTP